MDDGTYYIYAVISDTTSSVSDYGEASITIDTTPPSVSAEPPGGTYSSAQSVEVSADEPGWIYYTTDGSEPTTGSLLYSAPIGIAETTILKFMAMDALGNRSATVTEVYVFDSARPSLVILEPSGDIFTNAEAVGISWEDADDDDNAVVALFYDTDAEGNDGVMIVSGIEEDADEESDTYLWHIGGLDEGAYYIYGSITDDQETVLSPYAAGAVIIDRTAPVPEASPQGGLYTTPQSVVLSANEPAHLYYTLDGTEPTAASSLYDNPIMVEANTTIRFMAVDAAGNQSGVSIADYIIQEEVQDISIIVRTDKARKLIGVKVYAFTATGSYTGKYALTDADGIAHFDPADFGGGEYRFRVDYAGNQFWSEVFNITGAGAMVVTIPEEAVEVTVVTGSGPGAGVRVYLFSEAGSYLSQYETTDEAGTVSFVLPEGRSFAFRADMFGNQYWSDLITVSEGAVNTVTVDVGGGIFGVTVQEGDETPIAGIGV
ncbi:MAG: chitobiase/beta-hexosaminidase C-terminal domain-containing protein, partial [Deltaproteobacteria bacterium]|nr:chitobiase/beta-hexosaminidase C-terminal domain-containing protein [Candidatus Zymogenaceae bacterium]